MGSFYRKQLEDYLATTNVAADLLYDIGGKQKSVQGRTKSWNVKKIVCLDVPEYDLNEPQKLETQADFVFCLEVFEYLIDPLQALKNISAAMKPNATAIVTFPFVYPIHNEVAFDSLRYTETGIKRMAEKAGLKVKKVTNRKTINNTLVRYYKEDGMKMAKDQNHDITGYIFEFTK